ncbi:MAG: hypothetical protein AB7N80_09360 [Bdellovibrionales bacterium]
MTKNADSSSFLADFTLKLKERGALPKRIEVSEVGSTILANSFDRESSETISEFIYTGMDSDPSIAVLKSLVERAERYAFSDGYRHGMKSCRTERSDGFAAYPRGISKNPEGIARKNAFEEAVERYVWASWWDNRDFSHTVSNFSRDCASALAKNLVEQMDQYVETQQIKIIEPKIDPSLGLSVKLFFLFLRPFGVVSGGACGSIESAGTTEYRALCELYRHSVAISRIKETNRNPSTFYEQRLSFFGTSEVGQRILEERISTFGSKTIFLPRLSIDEPVPHKVDDLIAVHRCYFENQPPFVGGRLERLCL